MKYFKLALFISIYTFFCPINIPAYEIVDRIVAEVNGDIITLSELEERAAPFVSSIRRQAPPSIAKEKIEEARKEILDQLIDQLIVRQEAQKFGISVTNGEVEKALNSIAAQNRISREQFKAELSNLGATEESYRLRIENQILRQKVVSYEVTSKLVITDEKIKEYYDNSYTSETNTPDGYHILQLGFTWGPNSKSKTRAQAMALAENIRRELGKGVNFQQLAKEFSELPSAEDGGDIGVFKQDEMAPYMFEAVTQLKPGEYSGIIDTPSALQILKLLSAKQDGKLSKPPLEAVSEDIKETLYKQEAEKRYDSWMKELREKTYIVKNI